MENQENSNLNLVEIIGSQYINYLKAVAIIQSQSAEIGRLRSELAMLKEDAVRDTA